MQGSPVAGFKPLSAIHRQIARLWQIDVLSIDEMWKAANRESSHSHREMRRVLLIVGRLWRSCGLATPLRVLAQSRVHGITLSYAVKGCL
jgi:hypothetical protein